MFSKQFMVVICLPDSFLHRLSPTASVSLRIIQLYFRSSKAEFLCQIELFNSVFSVYGSAHSVRADHKDSSQLKSLLHILSSFSSSLTPLAEETEVSLSMEPICTSGALKQRRRECTGYISVHAKGPSKAICTVELFQIRDTVQSIYSREFMIGCLLHAAQKA